MQVKKLTIAAGTIASLLAVNVAAHAGTSATLTISGTVTPAACTIALSGGGTLTFDPVSIEALPSSGTYTMAPKTIDTTVDCQNTA